MKKPANWENVKATAPSMSLPKGAYAIKIMGAKEEIYKDKSGREFSKLAISFDIAEGEYKDFYANQWRSQTQEDKKWKGVYRIYCPKDDGTPEDARTQSNFKAFIDSVEGSNSGYHWDWNPNTLKDKAVGCIFRLEEYDFNGYNGWSTRPVYCITIEKLKSGEFKLPNDKPLKIEADTQHSAADVIDDGDLPF